MAASFPGSVRTFSEKIDLVDTVFAEHINSLQEEMHAVQTILGTNPHGSSATVRARIQALDTATVKKAGDTMTGHLGLPTGPSASQAARRDYVDERIQRAGDTMAGHLGLPSGPAGSQAARRDYVDTQRDTRVAKAGDTMTGALTLSGDPTLSNHAARKAYVDAAIAAAVSAAIPPGIIAKWFGSVGSIPTGWRLCDGGGGTPDLRGRFVVGAGGDYAVGATGGAETVSLTSAQMPQHSHSGPSHTHSGPSHTHSTPAHSHTVSGGSHPHSAFSNPNTGHTHQGTNSLSAAPATSGSVSVSINAGGNHSHGISGGGGTTGSSGTGNTGASGTGNTGSTGSGNAHENRPPYYAICYIMKVA